MFGYVVVNKGELKIKEFEVYQSFYCGLCQALHQQYGRIAQTALNNDMTFLAILLSGLYEPQEHERAFRCGFHPVNKRVIKENPYIAYAADMTILLTYMKCNDDWQDEHKVTSLAYQKLLTKGYHTVEKKYPEKVAAIMEAMKELSVCELDKQYDLDRVSGLFGKVMGEIVSYREDEWKTSLYRIGDYLGRFIYILDAYDDIEDDLAHQQYNPFTKDYGEAYFEERSKMVLELMIAEAAQQFETLPVIKYLDILRNILYSGIWTKYEIIKKKRSGEENGSL